MPELPRAAESAWVAYKRIRARKGGGGMGPGPIEWPDVDAFLRLSGAVLFPWEIELVETLDDAWLRVMTDKHFQWTPEGEGDDRQH